MGDCSLTVIWYTPDACARPASAPPACPLLAYGPLRARPGLAGLTARRWSAAADSLTVQARLCGGATSDDGPCAGAAVCVTAAGRPVPVGAADQPARLTATVNGTVTLTYGRAGKGTFIRRPGRGRYVHQTAGPGKVGGRYRTATG